MPALYLPVIIATFNLMVLSVLGFYMWTLQKERKELEKHKKELSEKERELESGYRQIIENALAKERKIIEEATAQARSILSNTQSLSSASKDDLDKALQKMIYDVQNYAATSSNNLLNDYKNYLDKIAEKTLMDFQSNTKRFEDDMQKKMQDFRDTLLPGIQKELDEYKNKRFQEADKVVNEIIKRVTQKVINKSLSPEDHKQLIIDSLEKCRKEGIFD